MDAITLLKNDHKAVEKLFKQFEKTKDDDHESRRRLVDQMIEELSVHASIEEQVFYPAVREDVPDTEDTVLEGLEEHHIFKWTLDELKDMDPEHERFEPKVTVLMESVRHHVEEEEGELFPRYARPWAASAWARSATRWSRPSRVRPPILSPRRPTPRPATWPSDDGVLLAEPAGEAQHQPIERA